MSEKDPIEELFRFASSWFSEGDYVTAEQVCRAVLLSRPNHAAAHDMIGLIAVKLGNYRSAVACFQRALAADPRFADAKNHLESVRSYAERATPPQPGPRYLVIKAWGFGFWSDVNHVLGALLLAEITGRIPITQWGENSLFSDGVTEDAFGLYFEPVSESRLAELPLATPRNVFAPKWAAVGLETPEHMKMEGPGSRLSGVHFLERPESIAVADFFFSVAALAPWLPDSHPMHGQRSDAVYRYLVEKYLKPKPHILAAAADLYRKLIGAAPAIAVHMRGSDKLLEADTTKLLPLYFEHLDREDAGLRIFLLTDDARCIAPFKQRYGDRVIVSDVLRTSTDLGVHYSPDADRVRLGNEVLIDTYAALHCDKFLGNGMSNLSALISVLKPWDANACVLLGGSILHLSLS